MPTQLEKERKYLVKFPASWSVVAELLDHAVDVLRIEQTYLKAQPGQQAVRVRKTVSGMGADKKTSYHVNQKQPIETGVHKEKENDISEKEYQRALKHGDPEKCSVYKTRFVFNWHDQEFELDLFKDHLKGLAILELEMSDINNTVELPSFLKIIKEITKDKRFNNFSLANKELKNEKNSP